ncbi:hypothetical protein NDU88_006854 [Pleurodeles waltl]|uniref:Uncharacterized protein n=1 Tax=Pleurodeles waltl TaxID=8319 RepID=A0AAV7X505_PLEWA|nr:hypothetical protein NDU88_006854 [Pleurodeles waltl]
MQVRWWDGSSNDGMLAAQGANQNERDPDGYGDVDVAVNELLDYDEEELEEGELWEVANDEAAWWLSPNNSRHRR